MMNLIKVNTVFKLLKNISICFLIFLNTSIYSQKQPLNSTSKEDSHSTKNKEEDILKSANYYIAKKEYHKAEFLLSKHYNQYSESLVINWLYAHVLSINNDKIHAEEKFKKAISISPKNKEVKMDYVRMLYELGQIDKIESILSNLIDDNFKNIEFLLMQANISFWKGDLNSSQKQIDRIKEIYPKTEVTKNLEKQIKELTALYIKTNFEYQTDSQPMEYFAEHIVLGQYKSRYLNLKLEISNYNFSPQKEQALILKLNNQFSFDKLKLTADVTGGVYKNFSGETDWVGGIRFKKKITENSSFNFGYSKESLLGTIPSTTFNLTHQDVFGEIDYNNRLIAFHAGYNQQFFEEDNYIKSFGSWLVSQPIKIQKFNFQFGYGYSFSDSKNNLFIFDNQGSGVYDPYFTPKDQEIHSGLLISSYNPMKKLTLHAKVNYGFIATVRNPYPNEFDNEIGGFYDEEFTSLELVGSINYIFSDRFSANAMYTYQETFFYTRDNINLGLNYTF